MPEGCSHEEVNRHDMKAMMMRFDEAPSETGRS